MLILGCMGLGMVLQLVQPPHHGGTVLEAAWRVVTLQSRTDSWEPMENALRVWRSPDGADVYRKMFFAPVEKFQYPPAALFFAMGVEAGPDFGPVPFETVTLLVSLLALAAATGFTIDRVLELRGIDPGTTVQRLGRQALIAGLLVTFYPFAHGFEVGQAQVWIDALFGLGLAAWVGRRRMLSGMFIGLACLIKPQLGVLLLWALIRGEWRFCAGVAALCGAAFGVSLLYFGLENHLGYLRVLSFLSQHGESLYANQSVNGLIGRLVSLSDPVHFNNLRWREGLPPYHPTIYAGTLISSIAILMPALFWRSSRRPIERTLDFCAMALSATMASPVAWDHHYGVVFPIYGAALAAAWGKPWAVVGLAMSYVVAMHYVPGTGYFAHSPLNIVQSYLFFAAILLLGILYRMRVEERREAGVRASARFGGEAAAA